MSDFLKSNYVRAAIALFVLGMALHAFPVGSAPENTGIGLVLVGMLGFVGLGAKHLFAGKK